MLSEGLDDDEDNYDKVSHNWIVTLVHDDIDSSI